ncbi:hypothetical protein [Streptomyces sp. R41]|uniref:Uncharacterized protein n=1 Tax=Streptomyces sp. R41 TaxID=3238632 RepID=A0AB39R9A5_9ACTN
MKTIRTGLVLAILLGLSDVLSVLITDGEHPPRGVAIATTVLGVVTLAAAVLAWRGNRTGFTITAVTRVISALSAVPALIVDDVTAGIRIVTAMSIALTAVLLVLIRPSRYRSATAPAHAS